MTIFQDSAETRALHRQRERELDAAAVVVEAARALLSDRGPAAAARLVDALAAYDAVVEARSHHAELPHPTSIAHREPRPVFSRDRLDQIGGWQRGRPHGPRRG